MRLVVSLTTIPSRFSSIEKTLKSLVNQKLKPDAIYIGIPKISARDGEKLNYKTPHFLPTYQPLLQLIPIEFDFGPICKLFAGCYAEQNECRIVTVDDDMEYPDNFLQDLVDCSNEYPTSAIGSSGVSYFPYPPFLNLHINFCEYLPGITHSQKHGSKMDYLMGMSGVLFKKSFFPSLDLLKSWTKDSIMRRTDDVTISAYLSLQGISRRICRVSQNWKVQDIPHEENALSSNMIKSRLHHVWSYNNLQKLHGAFSSRKDSILNAWTAWLIIGLIVSIIITFYIVKSSRVRFLELR